MKSILRKKGESLYFPIFLHTGWDRFVSIKIKSWELFYTDWLTTPGVTTNVVHFENLKDALRWNLLKVLDFLNLQPDSQRLQCLFRHEEGFFHRKNNTKVASKSSMMKDPYTNEQKRKIRAAIKKVNQALIQAGKESMPLHKYEFL